MGLTFPREGRLEVYANGWYDVSTSPANKESIVIKRASGDEQPSATPTTMDCTMVDPNADWSLENPLGRFADYLDRNSPIRRALRVMRDNFDNVVINDWGNTDTGEVWHMSGAGGTVQASDFQKTGSAGTLSVPVALAYRFGIIWDELYKNVEVRSTVSVPITDVTGGDIEPCNPFCRYVQATGSYYMARARVTSAEVLTLDILYHDGVGNTDTSLSGPSGPVTVPGLVDAISNKNLRVAIQAEGQTIRAKVYAPGTVNDPNKFEPLVWQLAVHDTRLQSAGGVGVRDGVGGSNSNTKPIVFSHTDFEVRLPRFHGELTDITPTWDESNLVRYSAVLASGIFMRLAQGETPLFSAPRRFLNTWPSRPNAFWTLETGELQDKALSDLFSVSPGFDYVQKINGNIAPSKLGWGKGDLAPWLPSTVDVGVGDTINLLACPLPSTLNTTGQWIVDAMVRFNGGASTTNVSEGVTFAVSDAVNPDWVVTWDSFNQTGIPTGPISLQFDSGNNNETQIFDGKAHWIRLRLAQSGPGIIFVLYVDGVQRFQCSGLLGAPWTIVQPLYVALGRGASDKKSVSWGYVAFWDGASGMTTSDNPTLQLVYGGYLGELAGIRAQRICQENGVPFSYLGDLTKTAPMGPQSTTTLMGNLQECADVDQAFILESKGENGVLFICNNYVYNQSSITLDYSAKQIAPSLIIKRDDKTMTNDFVAKRLNGAEYRAQRLTGRGNRQDPGTIIGAVGHYDDSATVNAQLDTQLTNIAGAAVSRGADGISRAPSVNVFLGAGSAILTGQQQAALMDMEATARLVVTKLQNAKIYRDLELFVHGYTDIESTQYHHEIEFGAFPGEPWRGVLWTDSDAWKFDTDIHILNAAITGTPGTFSVANTDGLTLWTTLAANFPIDVEVSVGFRPGEVIRISGISGATSPQTFTVQTRGINGITRDWPAGAKVKLSSRRFWRLT